MSGNSQDEVIRIQRELLRLLEEARRREGSKVTQITNIS